MGEGGIKKPTRVKYEKNQICPLARTRLSRGEESGSMNNDRHVQWCRYLQDRGKSKQRVVGIKTFSDANRGEEKL